MTDTTGKPLFEQVVGAYTGDHKLCPSFTAIGEKPPLVSGFFTKSDGSYRLVVPPGTYMIKVSTKGGYTPVFWKDKTECTQADYVTVQSSMVLNFVLH